MAITKDEVIEMLRPDEPSYLAIAIRLGADAAPVLAELATSADLEFAAKSASLAGFMDKESARLILSGAVTHVDPTVRVAAAGSVHVVLESTDLVTTLLADTEPGVRRSALRSLELSPSTGLREQVALIADSDSEPALRALARRIEPTL